MTNGIISKYELADKKTLETSGSWLTVEQKKGNKMALICTRDLAKFKWWLQCLVIFWGCLLLSAIQAHIVILLGKEELNDSQEMLSSSSFSGDNVMKGHAECLKKHSAYISIRT